MPGIHMVEAASIRATSWAAGSGRSRRDDTDCVLKTVIKTERATKTPNQVSGKHGRGAKRGKPRSKGRRDPSHKHSRDVHSPFQLEPDLRGVTGSVTRGKHGTLLSSREFLHSLSLLLTLPVTSQSPAI